MSLDGIIGGFAHYQRLQSSSRDDDWADHLNHIYTVIVLVVFAIFVSGKQYVGNPIECFSEDIEFGASKREYARTYCWLQNTYRVGTHADLPRDAADRRQAEIPYYQWVPIVLLVLAVMFKTPNLMWRATSMGSGLDLTQLASLVNKTQLMAPDKAGEALHQLAEYLDRWLSSNHPGVPGTADVWCTRLGPLAKLGVGKRHGNYLTGLYLLTKAVFLANSVTVFVLLWHILGGWYVDFGIKLLFQTHGAPPPAKPTDGLDGGGSGGGGGGDYAWPDLPYFPKLTFCDFTVRQQANINVHTMQCALPINMFNEKIFAFLWFWVCFVTVANLASFLHWMGKMRFGTLHCEHIRFLLDRHGDLITGYDRHLALTFGREYLRSDGCFVFHVILKNSNSLVTCDLLSQLFALYRSKVPVKKEKGGCGDIMYI